MAAEQKVIIYYKIFTSKIYSNLGSPSDCFWCQRSQRNFSRTFLCSGEIEFLREGENCFLFTFLVSGGLARPGSAFPQLHVSSADSASAQAAIYAHYYPCYCLNFFIRFLYQLLILSSVLIGETSFALLWECSCCWLLLLLAWSWLVVCQHLTKHRQSFSHSLPRPSFPYVLLRLQYVSSPREKMS